MFALISTTPTTLNAVPRVSVPRGRRVASTTVVASAATPSVVKRAQKLATSGLLAATLVLSPMAVAPAFAEGCQSTCEAECLKVAPGSGDYCASACSDECSAMKADNGGQEVEAGAFGQRQEKGDFENLLDKMLDTQKIFFVGPSSQMKKQ